jgi:hypothetical protein
MKQFDWSKVEITSRSGLHPAVPAICGFFYFAAGVHEIAGELADSIERYIGFVGLSTLQSYAAKSGEWKPMTKRQLDRDMKLLRDFPQDHMAKHIRYDAGLGGVPSGFGVHLSAEVDDAIFPKKAGLLRFDFPPRLSEGHDAEALIDLVSATCQMPHVQSAQVGLTFKTTPGSQRDAKPQILAKLTRYFGFSPCDFSTHNWMRGHTLTAHWLNYLDDPLSVTLGGPDAIVEALSECDVRKLTKGVLIRGAKLPPIGDINRKAPDLGWLPEVARVLKPTRVDISATYLGHEGPDFDATKWIQRMDDLDARSWDNADAI